jgi:hypothetical protein
VPGLANAPKRTTRLVGQAAFKTRIQDVEKRFVDYFSNPDLHDPVALSSVPSCCTVLDMVRRREFGHRLATLFGDRETLILAD